MDDKWVCYECKTVSSIESITCTNCNKQRWIQLRIYEKDALELRDGCKNAVSAD